MALPGGGFSPGGGVSPPPPPPPPSNIGNDKTFIPYWPQIVAVQVDDRGLPPQESKLIQLLDGKLSLKIDARMRRSSEIQADILNSLMRQGQLVKTGLNTWTIDAPSTGGLTGTFDDGPFGTEV